MQVPSDLTEVTVQFFGICTHIEPGSGPPGVGGHRVVLVNASDLTRYPHLPGTIEPHVAELQIRRRDMIEPPRQTDGFRIVHEDEELVAWSLEGVQMSFENALPFGVGPDFGTCIPHLQEYCDSALSALGPAVSANDPTLTACVFDFPTTRFVGRRTHHGENAVGILTVYTHTQPMLTVMPLRSIGTTVRVPILPGAQITVTNLPRADKEGDEDFLLHFLVCATWPNGVRYPTRLPPCTELFETGNPPRCGCLSGPGCSNSNWP